MKPSTGSIAARCSRRSPLSAAHAQSDYPNKPVQIIIDSAAGSANDATARILGDKLSHIWGQQVLIINQPGAGGGISAKAASQSPNDGYTLYMPATSPFLTLPGASGVAPNLPLELPRDFAAIGFMLQQPLFIGASHKSGINSIADADQAREGEARRGHLRGNRRGRLTHLTMELLQARTGIKLQLVPYSGGTAQAMNDVMSGQVQLVLDAYAGLAPAIKGNLIKGLADTALERLPGFENLPTIAETVPDFFVGAWAVLVAPLGTPDADHPQGQRRPVDRAERSGREDQVPGQRRVPAQDVAGGNQWRSPRSSRRPGGRSWSRSRR